MKVFKIFFFASFFIFLGCSIKPKTSSPTNRYLLVTPKIQSVSKTYDKTLKIALPKGAKFLFTNNIAYVENGSSFGFYQHNKWEESPAKQLQLIFSSIIRQSSLFKNVIISPTQIQNDLLLESKVDSFVYSFDENKSHIKIAINLFLVDKNDKKVLKNGYFEVIQKTSSKSPKGIIDDFNKAIKKLSYKIITWLT